MSAADTLQWVQIAAALLAVLFYLTELSGVVLGDAISPAILGFAMFTVALVAALASVAIDPSILTGANSARR